MRTTCNCVLLVHRLHGTDHVGLDKEDTETAADITRTTPLGSEWLQPQTHFVCHPTQKSVGVANSFCSF